MTHPPQLPSIESVPQDQPVHHITSLQAQDQTLLTLGPGLVGVGAGANLFLQARNPIEVCRLQQLLHLSRFQPPAHPAGVAEL